MLPLWAKNILFLLVYMISGLVLVVIIEGLVSGTDLIPLNTAVEKVIVGMRTPILTTLLVKVTQLGNPFVLSSATLFAATILLVKRRAYEAILFVVAMMVATTSLVVFKNTFQITRPISDIYTASGWSFPSGHTTIATAFFFMLSYTFFAKMRTLARKIGLVLASIGATILVCFSRLYLGAHWTLDVLAGVALGLLAVSFTILIFNIFVERRRSLIERINS